MGAKGKKFNEDKAATELMALLRTQLNKSRYSLQVTVSQVRHICWPFIVMNKHDFYDEWRKSTLWAIDAKGGNARMRRQNITCFEPNAMEVFLNKRKIDNTACKKLIADPLYQQHGVDAAGLRFMQVIGADMNLTQAFITIRQAERSLEMIE